MNIGGSHDTAENSLFDLQAVAVQMVMLRLDALMGWFVLHPLMSDNNQHPFISNNTEASATSCDWILVKMSHRAEPILLLLLPAALLPCWLSSAWGLVCVETHQLWKVYYLEMTIIWKSLCVFGFPMAALWAGNPTINWGVNCIPASPRSTAPPGRGEMPHKTQCQIFPGLTEVLDFSKFPSVSPVKIRHCVFWGTRGYVFFGIHLLRGFWGKGRAPSWMLKELGTSDWRVKGNPWCPKCSHACDVPWCLSTPALGTWALQFLCGTSIECLETRETFICGSPRTFWIKSDNHNLWELKFLI